MKVSQFRNILEAAARIHGDAGNSVVSEALIEFSRLCCGHELKSVSSFANSLAKVLATLATESDSKGARHTNSSVKGDDW